MAASNTRFTQNSLGQSKNPIDSDHGIYRDHLGRAGGPKAPTLMPVDYEMAAPHLSFSVTRTSIHY